MTPEPFRGGRNEPAIVGYAAYCLAEVRGQEPAEFAAELNKTFDEVYGILSRGAGRDSG